LTDETPLQSRKKRRDAGDILLNQRDRFALTWIGHQYTIRLDHLQILLGQQTESGEKLGESAARHVVTRWEKAGWVRVKRLLADEPYWVWLTHLGLRKVGLPYNYKDIKQSSTDNLEHLAAINEIRLLYDDGSATEWIAERQLLQGVVYAKGREALHRPDAVAYWDDGGIIAIEAELSGKKPLELAENLMELIRGEKYLRLKNEHGAQKARKMSQGEKSVYTEIWYFAPPKIRKLVQQQRAELLARGDLTEEEADRLFVRWYPLATTEEEEDLEDQEDNEAFELQETHSKTRRKDR
jgi:hypothetical protein